MYNRWIVTFFLSTVILFTSFSGYSQDDTSGKAQKQYELGLYTQAAFSLEKYMREGEMDKMFYAMLADCYDKMNEPEKTVEIFEEMDAKYDLTMDEYLLWGLNLKKLEKYQEAKAVFSKMNVQDKITAQRLINSCDVEDLKVLDDQLELVNMPWNTPQSDFCPAWLGEKIVYGSSRSDIVRQEQINNSKRNAFQNQLYQVERVSSETTSKPVFLQNDLKDYQNNGPVSFAPATNKVVFVRNHFVDGQTQINPRDKSAALYFADLNKNGDWENEVAFPYNSVEFSNTFPHLSNDGNLLVYSSNRDGGEGGYDLYFSELVNEKWTEPRSMGDVINSPGNEVSPFVKSGYVYFASDWHRGLGGFDLFRCDFGDSHQVIENLGGGINSSRDDYSLILAQDGQSGYFTSNRVGGKGLEDVYTFEFKPRVRFAAVMEGETSKTAVPGMREERGETRDENSTQAPKMESKAERSISMVETQEDGERVTMFSIQVAAFAKDWGGFPQMSKELGDLGKVYKVYYAEFVKVRVGNFMDEQEARSALATVKTRGYKDAFVVKEEVVKKNTSEVIDIVVEKETEYEADVPKEGLSEPKTIEKTQSIIITKSEVDDPVKVEKEVVEKEVLIVEDPSPSEPEVVEEPKEEILTKEILQEDFDVESGRLKDQPVYRIRVAAYTNPEWFAKNKVAHLGKIIEDKQGEWTIFYLGDFSTIEEAESIRLKVKDAGYSAAQLYELRNGELIKTM